MDRSYIAIDLKSFYASAECADRKLEPLTTNLVVADQSRTNKTICPAVSPSLKACGIPGRPRSRSFFQVQLPPCGGSHPVCILENPAEIKFVAVAAKIRDFIDPETGIPQKTAGFLHSQVQ